VDGIYPSWYARFVKGMREPILVEDKRLTKWQESARKDIERAFGALVQQNKFKAMAYPIHLWIFNVLCTVWQPPAVLFCTTCVFKKE
jgi:hypothetical protein